MTTSILDDGSKKLWGTQEGSLLWWNTSDWFGLLCAPIVLLLLIAVGTVTIVFYEQGYFSFAEAISLGVLTVMTIWSHCKVMFTDPGAVPRLAKPIKEQQHLPHVMCGRCDAYKPPMSHHDRITNRCICRMDHYCPWTNNSIGAGNQKAFILFIVYADALCITMYSLLATHLVLCSGDNCSTFAGYSLLISRILIFLLVLSILFTSGMILNQIYGIVSGLGTIDRLKQSRTAIRRESIPLKHIFGVNWWFALLPVDPHFADRDAVFMYRLVPSCDL